jgi:hypothetical protein
MGYLSKLVQYYNTPEDGFYYVVWRQFGEAAALMAEKLTVSHT